MQPQRETMTDNLADIIHIIRIGCKSGTLTVERGEGKAIEEGFITFIDGKAIDARAGLQNGLAAFNYLKMWQTCRFSFIDHAGQHGSPRLPPALPPPASQPGNTPTGNLRNGNAATSMNMNGRSRPYTESERQPVCPSRSPLGEVALQHPENMQLPRHHRRLFLLINGQRSVYELARLMVRDLNEVQILLNELERSGLIQQ